MLLAGCGPIATPSASPPSVSSAVASASGPLTPSASPAVGELVPAPGSSSEVYRPNPAAIVVAIDPGHGGCLDWGVPDPSKRDARYAEKTMTLGIALALESMLQSQGISVVMTRHDDSALAGDSYAPLGCDGAAWRDVDGDGRAGFEPSGHVRTRDELSARIDLANLARADVLVSIHINSMTQDGVAYRIAATQTFYDDETPWKSGSARLATDVQTDVVTSLDGVAGYARQDRGVQTVAYYLISRQWAAADSCGAGGDVWCKPHRALQMPGILSEVGSISLPAEQDLLASPAGQRAAAQGVYAGLRSYFANRPLAVRYDALTARGAAGAVPATSPGSGPPFRAPTLAAETLASGRLPLRLTNTGTAPWSGALQLDAGWLRSNDPYLASAPALAPLALAVPALEPGESVQLEVPLPTPPSGGGRAVLWLGLSEGGVPLAESGSPALQLAAGG